MTWVRCSVSNWFHQLAKHLSGMTMASCALRI